ncbi:glutathione S-transferase family protein [Marinibacterium profundimaris]|uniref:Glutathione S-transferase n=1 Tax=Marinibacterium profundimaris TaxID=1679460 RepID=A0A225NNY6_9RHOB|nr:glutathione S-transferase family protein [Marinibacterium profundimaris]OWU76191.1 glutathione S-transferase [Marinibacterium profundimaris]
MKLYFSPGTIASASAIALEEAGLPYEPVRVDFAAGEQREEPYLSLNPKGRVPVLITTDGTFTETGAILEYIAARAPEAGLAPADPVAQAQMRAAMYYFASTMHPNHAHGRRGARWADDPAAQAAMAAKVPETMTACCDYVENHMLTGPFILGDRPSVADCYLYTISTWLEGDSVDITAFPKLQAFRETMAARPSVQAVVAKGMIPQ